MTADHLRHLLDSEVDTALLWRLAQDLARGNSDEIVDVVRLGLMTAFCKPKALLPVAWCVVSLSGRSADIQSCGGKRRPFSNILFRQSLAGNASHTLCKLQKGRKVRV